GRGLLSASRLGFWGKTASQPTPPNQGQSAKSTLLEQRQTEQRPAFNFHLTFVSRKSCLGGCGVEVRCRWGWAEGRGNAWEGGVTTETAGDQPARLRAGRRTWQRPSGETCLQGPKCSGARQEPHQARRSMTSRTGAPPVRVFSGRLQGGTPPLATSSPGDGPGQLLQGAARQGPEVTRWYIMRNAGLEEAQAGFKITRRNINNLRYADDTTRVAESEEELKSLLMKVKESEKVG
uniref:Uncharacterized protein n=1 Tax=Ovis aries TaxID=9940 RepID=A0AC11ERX9_SHEEP